MNSDFAITSRVLKNNNRAWEREQKEKFARKAQSSISYSELIQWCINEDKQNHKMARLNYRTRCFIADGAYQLHRAIEGVFGTVTAQGQQQMSGGGEGAISTIDIQLADGTRMKVPFGTISLEGLGEGSVIDIAYDEHRHELVVTGKCQVRFQALMDDIIETMREGLANNSIYKGQALEISNVNEPKVMDLSGIDKQLMVLSDKTEYALRPIYARINNPERCIKKGIPLKFGALLEGGYGTGKTLLAFKLARMAVNKGWVFIYLKNPSELAESIRMARTIDRSGHGCIIFTEDIDQVTRGNRDAAMQDILNTLDGGDTKDMNVISLFTTNHIELIEPTFLRGKRIGTIISMGDLDAKTANVFIRKSFEDGDYVIKDDLTDVCQYISENHIAPAFMAEIIEKVKAIMVLDDQIEVKASDLRNSVESYLDQVRLAQTKDMSESKADKFYAAFADMVVDSPVGKNVRNLTDALKDRLDLDIDTI